MNFRRTATYIVLVLAFAFATSLAAAPVPRVAQLDARRPNSNMLIKRHAGQITVSASSFWVNWPAEHVIDGDHATAWYSENGDAPMCDRQPWVQLRFPEDITVRRITILGTRDPQYPNGYFILEGTLQLLDEHERVLLTRDLRARGEYFDLEWLVERSPAQVRAIRFIATKDQQQSRCVGFSEFLVE